MSDLIIVRQIPIIEEKLKTISQQIDKEVKGAKSLVCTEENVKTVKEVRAKLNSTFKALEEERKTVKNAVMEPYNDFEKTYKECVTDKFKSADIELKTKIDAVENELRAKKEQDIKDYFEEYKTANNIDFVTYEQARINVTLTASMKSLKEQCKAFVDKIVDDLKLIETQQHKAEILVEYKQSLNVSNAITTVTNRFKAIEEEKKKRAVFIEEVSKAVIVEAKDNTYAEQKQVLQAPTKEQEEILTLKFTVRGTKTKLKELKQFLENGGYDYE